MKSISHNKVKNAGILFELLARQLTTDILSGQKESKALGIIQEHFKPSSELGKELSLYRAFFATNGLTEIKALKFIDLIIEQRKKINESLLNKQKYNLIKSIREVYDIDTFLSAKIPQYKIYASIFKTFIIETASYDTDDVVEAAGCRFTLSEHLCLKPVAPADTTNISETLRQNDAEIRNLAYVIMLRKFNNKYKELNESQRHLLREYIMASPVTNSLKTYLNDEVPKVKQRLVELEHQLTDKVAQIKLHEIIAQLDNITKGKTVKDNQVTAMMIAYQIIDELSNPEI